MTSTSSRQELEDADAADAPADGGADRQCARTVPRRHRRWQRERRILTRRRLDAELVRRKLAPSNHAAKSPGD